MSDRYGELVQSGLGRTVAKNLGLPMPVGLERFELGQPVLTGEVLVGFGSAEHTDKRVQNALLDTLHDLKASLTTDVAVAYQGKSALLQDKLSEEKSRFKVVIFDATNLRSAADLNALYEFFHPIARRIKNSGKIVIIGRPECCTANDVGFALAQRALLGFAKSIAKEFKRGINANVIYLKEGNEAHLAGALRFFVSTKSAYVSGQAITVGNQGEVVQIADDSKPLADKTILVTGAARGIGAAIAEVLARDGARVLCLDVPAAVSDLQKVASKIGGRTITLDITSDTAGQTIAETCQTLGVSLDGVVHNAGVTRDKTLANMDENKWQMVININLASIASINAYLLDSQVLAANAHIVCVSSISGIAGNLGQTNYATSKAGVIGLVNATAKQLNGTARTINAVAPGFIETKMTGAIPFAIREAGRRMNSMSQGGEPVDVAETIAWLLSDNANGINGQTLRVCGQSLLGA
ncbi:MAG: 3-oxoacyl-ACP reductase [Moraxella sp.]|nr:3-oxoacyl-ACP reductase [Moraxella sp.]